jgi:hypothetical protein
VHAKEFEGSDTRRELLRATVRGWIQGDAPNTSDSHINAGQCTGTSVRDASHAKAVLEQQLAEAEAVLAIDTVDGASMLREAAKGTAVRGNRHIFAAKVSSADDVDAECSSCASRWFLLPHESHVVCPKARTRTHRTHVPHHHQDQRETLHPRPPRRRIRQDTALMWSRSAEAGSTQRIQDCHS